MAAAAIIVASNTRRVHMCASSMLSILQPVWGIARACRAGRFRSIGRWWPALRVGRTPTPYFEPPPELPPEPDEPEPEEPAPDEPEPDEPEEPDEPDAPPEELALAPAAPSPPQLLAVQFASVGFRPRHAPLLTLLLLEPLLAVPDVVSLLVELFAMVAEPEADEVLSCLSVFFLPDVSLEVELLPDIELLPVELEGVLADDEPPRLPLAPMPVLPPMPLPMLWPMLLPDMLPEPAPELLAVPLPSPAPPPVLPKVVPDEPVLFGPLALADGVVPVLLLVCEVVSVLGDFLLLFMSPKASAELLASATTELRMNAGASLRILPPRSGLVS